MSLSVDPSQLDTVVKYASFIDLLVHPERMQAILDGIIKATADYKETLGVVTSKQEVDNYLKKEADALKEERKVFEKTLAEHEASAALENKKVLDLQEQSARIVESLNKKHYAAEECLKEAAEKKQEAEDLLFNAKRQFVISENQKIELEKIEKDLKEKQEKLLKIMG